MAYYARKYGAGAFNKRATQKDVRCIICEEEIKKGDVRYTKNAYINVCIKCIEAWQKEGSYLGSISRSKNRI